MILQFFFQGKSQELIKIFSKLLLPINQEPLEFLQRLDVPHAPKYKEALK